MVKLNRDLVTNTSADTTYLQVQDVSWALLLHSV